MLDEDSLERELSCGICFELYNEPLQLPCMHTFCKDCIKDIIANTKNKKLKCPDCRRNADLGKQGIESLRRNFKLASIVDVYRQALERSSLKEAVGSKQCEASTSAVPTSEEKDYEFLSSVIKSSHDNSSDPLEPHVLDDLWGTFKRTARKGSHMPKRPPAPPPPRSQTNASSGRPLPPVPSRSPPQRGPLNLSHPIRPLPPEPTSTLSQDLSNIQKPLGGAEALSPLQLTPDIRLEPSAPPYFTLSDVVSGPTSGNSTDEDVMFDMASLSAPPVPPRSSYPPGANTGVSKIENRPPIPVPRGNLKKKKMAPGPPLPNRNTTKAATPQSKEGKPKESRRPPPPVPRSGYT